MNILIVATADDRSGGGNAAYRLMTGINTTRAAARMMVSEPKRFEEGIVGPRTIAAKIGSRIRSSLDSLPLHLYRKRVGTEFSPGWISASVARLVRDNMPDVVNLHWTCRGFVSPHQFSRFNRPVVWTLHDMWPITGGCHHSFSCDRYVTGCGKCPQLGSTHQPDLSAWSWQRKKRAYARTNLVLVSPSRWLANLAQKSDIIADRTQVKVIPNGIDLQKYRPRLKSLAREIFGLPQDCRLLLFASYTRGEDNPYKGYRYLEVALSRLGSTRTWADVGLVVLGGDKKSVEVHPSGLRIHRLGRLHDDESVSLLYSAVDVFVSSSIADNLPTTIIEAFSCGTPAVAFKTGGVSEIITHKSDGYVAEPESSEDLVNGIQWVLGDRGRHLTLSENARKKAEREFSLSLCVDRYLELFSDLLSNPRLVEKVPG